MIEKDLYSVFNWSSLNTQPWFSTDHSYQNVIVDVAEGQSSFVTLSVSTMGDVLGTALSIGLEPT